METCPLCSSSRLVVARTQAVDRLRRAYEASFKISVAPYFPQPQLQLYQCLACDLRHYGPALEGDAPFYDALQAAVPYYEADKPEFDFALRELARIQPRRVLEFGCGEGLFLRKIRGAFDVRGSEISARALEKLAQAGIERDAPADAYDMVVAFQVIEHVADVRRLLEDLLNKLEPGGRLLVTVPNADARYFQEAFDALDHPPHHMTRWTRQALESIGRVFDLEVESYFVEPQRFGHYLALIRARRDQLMTGGRLDPWLQRLGRVVDALALPYAFDQADYPGHTHGMVFRKPLRPA